MRRQARPELSFHLGDDRCGVAVALGFSPFAIDQIAAPPATALARAYALVAALEPLLLGAGPDRTAGVLLDKETAPAELTLGGFTLTRSRLHLSLGSTGA